MLTIPEELQGVLDIHPEIISGAVRFRGTRVPVQARGLFGLELAR